MHTREQLHIICERWIRELWQELDLDAIHRLHAPKFVDHSPSGRDGDNFGFHEGCEKLFTAFPDFYTQIEDVVVDEPAQKVAVRWRATGAHQKAYLGFEATERIIHFVGIEIIIVEDGLITDRWGEWDGLSLLDQLKN